MQAAARHPETKRDPERTCALTRVQRPRERLLRFVVDPDGTVVCDAAARLPGRGIWLSPELDVLNTAARKGVFARAAKRAVTVPEDLPRQAEAALAARALQTLALARRAGAAVAGFEKVGAMLRDGRAGLLLTARDAAADGRDKLGRLAQDLPVFALFGRDELGRIFGRDQAVHVAVAAGDLADRLEIECDRLAGFRQPAPAV
jgi:predicted RNA-binding protein YlxR (DUF448 family)